MISRQLLPWIVALVFLATISLWANRIVSNGRENKCDTWKECVK